MKEELGINWQLLSASASAILPNRWSLFWHYIIRRKALNYTLSAWVEPVGAKVSELALWLLWSKENGK